MAYSLRYNPCRETFILIILLREVRKMFERLENLMKANRESLEKLRMLLQAKRDILSEYKHDSGTIKQNKFQIADKQFELLAEFLEITA